MSTDIEKALYQLKSDTQIMNIHANNPKFKVIDLTDGKISEKELLNRIHKNTEFLVAAYESNQLKELPFMVMIERVIKDGEMSKLKKDAAFNGRYAVVYFDKRRWSAMPLVDICGDVCYKPDECNNRINEINDNITLGKMPSESDFNYIIRCVNAGKLPMLSELSDEGLRDTN